MHYYLYEIKNTVNGKIYVGVHKTKSLDDGYMGSGKVISRAIKKHGIENFTKTILETFDNSADMFAREKEVVNEEFLARDDVYNLRRGGTGGFDYINGIKNGDYIQDKRNAAKKMVSDYGSAHMKNISAIGRRIMMDNKIGVYADDYVSNFTNEQFQFEMSTRAKSPTALEKRKETFKQIKHSQGHANSQFGTCWMFCDWLKKNIKINKDLIPYYLDQGWAKGRKIFPCK